MGLDQGEGGHLTGRVTLNGQPIEGAEVHLTADHVSFAETRTDALGYFRFDPLEPGKRVLVVHDGAGHAATRELVLHGGGTNDVGTLALDPISRFPELVTYRGFGSTSARRMGSAIWLGGG